MKKLNIFKSNYGMEEIILFPEDSMTFFLIIFGALGFYIGYVIGKNVDRKFSKHKKLSGPLKFIFAVVFTISIMFSLEGFGNLEINVLEGTILKEWPNSEFSRIILEKSPFFLIYGIFWLVSFIIIRNSVTEEKDKHIVNNRIKLTMIFFLIATFIPFISNENLAVVFAMFQFSTMIGVWIGINKSDRLWLKSLIRWSIPRF